MRTRRKSRVTFVCFCVGMTTLGLFAESSAKGAQDAVEPVVGLERMAHPELLPFFLPVCTVTRQEGCYDPSGGNCYYDLNLFGHLALKQANGGG